MKKTLICIFAFVVMLSVVANGAVSTTKRMGVFENKPPNKITYFYSADALIAGTQDDTTWQSADSVVIGGGVTTGDSIWNYLMPDSSFKTKPVWSPYAFSKISVAWHDSLTGSGDSIVVSWDVYGRIARDTIHQKYNVGDRSFNPNTWVNIGKFTTQYNGAAIDTSIIAYDICFPENNSNLPYIVNPGLDELMFVRNGGATCSDAVNTRIWITLEKSEEIAR